mgnify:FL=1
MAVLVTGGARSGKSRFAESFAARLASRGIYVATAQPFDDEMAERIRAHREERGRSGFAWETVEEPLDLAGLLDRLAAVTEDAALQPDVVAVQADVVSALPEAAAVQSEVNTVQPAGVAAGAMPNRSAATGSPAGRPVVLVDCLTLWLSNHLLAICPDGSADRTSVKRELDARIEALAEAVRRFPHPLVLVTNEVGAGIVPETALGRLFRDAAGRMNQRLAGVCDRVFLVVSGIPVDLRSIAFRMDAFDGRPS